MCPIKLCIRQLFNYTFYDLWNFFYFFGACLVYNSNRKHYSSFFHLFIIVHPGICEVGVRAYQLFTAKGPDTCSFNAYILNSSHLVIHNNKIPDFERLVEEYYKITEEITEHCLRGKCNCNSTNSQTCNYSCNIVTQVINQEQ